MVGFSNQFIENVGAELIGSSFYGVFPCDAYPIIKKKNFSIIFNLSKHDEVGSHFIALIKNEKNIYYFDSFGKKCKNSYILKFMKKFNLPILHNGFQVQDRSSSYCGLFCLFFIIFFNFYTYTNLFSDFSKLFHYQSSLNKIKHNDVVLKKYIFSFIHKIQK